MNIGIVGTGQMGGMLARAFAQTASDTVYVYNRNQAKAQAVAADFTNISVCESWSSLIARVDAVFLCTKASDGVALMREMGPKLSSDQLFVTTISHVDLDHWLSATAATPVKLIPSLTQTVHRGVLLLAYPRNISAKWRDLLETRLSDIGRPVVIDEGQIRICSDLSSCGPAFLGTLCQSWAQAAAQTGAIERATAEILLREMLIGMAALLDSGMEFSDVIRRIRLPGGVTDHAISKMGDAPKALFSRLHQETARFSHGAHPKPLPDPLPTSRG